MISEKEILKQLILYIENQVSLDEFENWVIQESWNAHRDSDLTALGLIFVIELRLAEHSNCNLSDAGLREEFCKLIEPYLTEEK